MASFLEDLWGSIFVEGPTPTLLVATNVTFAALELVLVGLIFLTFSIHFVVLFVLAGALWAAINWFAAEIRMAKAEEEKTLKGRLDPEHDDMAADPDAGGDELSSGGDGEDTEVEAEGEKDSRSRSGRVASLAASQVASTVTSATKAAQSASSSASTRLGLSPQDEALRQRQRRSMAESTGSLSTDSEWEKVESEQ